MPQPGTGWFVASSPSSRRQVLEVASLNNLLLEEDLLPAALRLRPPPPLSSLESPCQGRRRRRRQRRRKNVEEAWGGQNSWLNISMDAALGFGANVFQVTRYCGQSGKKSSSSSASISVHPQAAPVVCRHTLEVLISLAKGEGGGNQRRSQGAFHGGRSVHRNGG